MVSRIEGQVEQVKSNLTFSGRMVDWFQELRVSCGKHGRTMMVETFLSQTRSIGNQEKGSNVNLVGERWEEISEATTISFRRGSFRMDFRVERYFAVNEIFEAEKLKATCVCLEGKALNWYYWIESRQPMLTWEDFKRELLNRFRHFQKINQYVSRLDFPSHDDTYYNPRVDLFPLEDWYALSFCRKEATYFVVISMFQVKSEVYSRHLEGSAHTRNEKWLDSTTAQQLEQSTRDATGVEDLKNPNGMKAESADWKGKAAAVLSGSCSCIDQEYEQGKGSSVSTSQATSINRDENCLLEEDHMLSISVFPECTVSSSNSSLSIENKSSFPVRKNQTRNGEDRRLLGPSTTLMPGEVVGHGDNNVVEAVTKHRSGTKFQNADKPKRTRRLLPVSSILLKDIGSINFKDENEKPKGVKAEKKGASGENRTQGSISLLRLLKDNLAI
ncbi:hypothetical protein MTR67_035242 [Solanum verrucosum]|uniref:Retrotransposon gag domain-containing protein n=1 Tax=Solanum verrucosum TaxID=315347 RepID=A0AAF0U9L0_SOLVR|nr:hypothetical protein MTR67_035242 [Solanum verrucosum]